MESSDILANSSYKKPLVCALCKSEYVSEAPITDRCNHELTSATNSQRYYETLTKNFRRTLAQVEQHTRSFARSIAGSERRIGSHYDRIRQEISARVEDMVRQLEAEKDLLFKEVDAYQRESEANFKACDAYKRQLAAFLEDAGEFADTWRNRPVEAGEGVLEAFKKGYSLKTELERRKIRYESFIFNKKIEFHRGCGGRLNVGYLVRLFDRLPRFDEWRRIDLKERLFLSLKNGDRIRQPYLVIEEFESGNLFYCYVYQNPDGFGITKIKLVVSDADGNYLRSLNEHTYASEFKVYKFRVG